MIPLPEPIHQLASDIGPIPFVIAAAVALAVAYLALFLRAVAKCQREIDDDLAEMKAIANREVL